MNRIPMLRQEEHTELYLFAEAIKDRRYFRKIPMNLLLEMLRLSQLVMLSQDEQLVRVQEYCEKYLIKRISIIKKPE